MLLCGRTSTRICLLLFVLRQQAGRRGNITEPAIAAIKLPTDVHSEIFHTQIGLKSQEYYKRRHVSGMLTLRFLGTLHHSRFHRQEAGRTNLRRQSGSCICLRAGSRRGEADIRWIYELWFRISPRDSREGGHRPASRRMRSIRDKSYRCQGSPLGEMAISRPDSQSHLDTQ